MDRLAPWAVATVLVVLMIAPALVDPPVDGFPLSTYPMFSVDRGERATVATAVGLLESGEPVRLSPRLLAGADEPILAVRTAGRAVATDGAGDWCVEVASRLVRSGSAGAEVVTVQVRSETHDVMATVLHGAEPLAVEVHAECPVVGR